MTHAQTYVMLDDTREPPLDKMQNEWPHVSKSLSKCETKYKARAIT